MKIRPPPDSGGINSIGRVLPVAKPLSAAHQARIPRKAASVILAAYSVLIDYDNDRKEEMLGLYHRTVGEFDFNGLEYSIQAT